MTTDADKAAILGLIRSEPLEFDDIEHQVEVLKRTSPAWKGFCSDVLGCLLGLQRDGRATVVKGRWKWLPEAKPAPVEHQRTLGLEG
jgi:hypothetical protein